MSALEETVDSPSIQIRTAEPFFTRILGLLSSVRLGVVLLVLLGLACLVGMLIMQQNVEGFANYYQTLTPAQRLVYGRLKFFDIYHCWYFNALLALLSTNIILASIDRFPKTWAIAAKPNLTVPLRWLKEQRGSATVTLSGSRDHVLDRLESELHAFGWRKIVKTVKDDKVFLFSEKGRWNRFGAYAVHVGLLTIFLGGFLTAQLGSTGQLPLAPGKSTDRMSETVVDLDRVNEVTMKLPFEIWFDDIEQKLIKKDGPILASNTIDWITRFTIKDDTGEHKATAQMNHPFDYRGYRFFQASFMPVGRARNITVRLTNGSGENQDVVIPRNGTAALADGTKIDFAEFRGNFRIGPEDTNEDTSAYPNPAAVLRVTPPNAAPQAAYAFGPQMAAMPVAKKPVAGYTFQLVDFEKVSDQHILSVQRDPGSNVVYVGFVLLFITLVGVFFFSHQRVWVVVDGNSENTSEVHIGGSTNRNWNSFEDKLARLVSKLANSVPEEKAK